jgi:hypothetical protein
VTELEQLWASKTDEQLAEASRSISEYTEAGEQVIRAELQRRGMPLPPVVNRAPASIPGNERDKKPRSLPLIVYLVPAWLLVQALQSQNTVAVVLIVSAGISLWAIWGLFRYPVSDASEKVQSAASVFWLIGIANSTLGILARFGIDPLGLQPSPTTLLFGGVFLGCGLVITVFRKVRITALVAVLAGTGFWSYDTVLLFRDLAAAGLNVPAAFYIMTVMHILFLTWMIGGLSGAVTFVFDSSAGQGSSAPTTGVSV